MTLYKNQGYVDRSQVAMAATMGAITSGASFGMSKGIEAPLNKAFSKVGSSLALQKGLSYGTNGAITGFTVGTGMGIANGQDFGDAAISGLRTVPIGFATGFGGGFYKGYNEALTKGVNPWNGKDLINRNYDFTPDPYGENVKLYRGTTGSENDNKYLFMTDDPNYAASYIKDGGTVIEVTVPRSTLNLMKFNGDLINYQGINTTGSSYIEYRFSPSVKPNIISLTKPYIP